MQTSTGYSNPRVGSLPSPRGYELPLFFSFEHSKGYLNFGATATG